MGIRDFLTRRGIRRRKVSENEGLNREDPFETDTGGIYSGTVGHGDGSTHYDIKPSGQTYVKVTLFDGRNPREDVPDDGLAHGTQILARVGAPLFTIPAEGSEVMVAIPAGGFWVPGSGVIFASVLPSPDHQYSATTAKLDFGDQRLVIKAKEVVLSDQEDRYIAVGPRGGIKMSDQTGSYISLYQSKLQFVCAVASGSGQPDTQCLMELAPGKLRASCKTDTGKGGLSLAPDTCAVSAQTFAAEVGNCKLGSSASPATPVVVGTSGQTGIGSLTIYGQV